MIAAVGKAKKNRGAEKKINKEVKKDDAILMEEGESGMIGDPQQTREVRDLSIVSKERKVVNYQDMEYETETNRIEGDKSRQSMEIEGGR